MTRRRWTRPWWIRHELTDMRGYRVGGIGQRTAGDSHAVLTITDSGRCLLVVTVTNTNGTTTVNTYDPNTGERETHQ